MLSKSNHIELLIDIGEQVKSFMLAKVPVNKAWQQLQSTNEEDAIVWKAKDEEINT
jgi:hypothetical protein